MQFKTFPANVSLDNKKKAIAAEIYGNRFHADQTLYEYLIEFLLIFVSGDDDVENPKEKLKFHNPNATGPLHYTVQPRIGLKRFIFFDKNKKNDAVEIDKIAYQEMINVLKEKINDDDEENKIELISCLQDLLHGYAVVLKKRTWCAQALLPICPELIFCEAMPNSRERAGLKWKTPEKGIPVKEVDNSFDFSKHNFLARGGELYYLHILQGLQGYPEKQKKLEALLYEQLVVNGKKMSQIANFIQDTWEEHMGYDRHPEVKLHMSFIPENAYTNIATDSVDELINYMSCRMHPIKKIELLSKGIMIQVMRMLSVATTNYLKKDRECWIVDMHGSESTTVKRIATEGLIEIQDVFFTAFGKNVSDDLNGESRQKQINKMRKDSYDVFKAKGKELQLIIPTSGPNERFSLAEDVIRFLVLSLIAPGQKMTLDMFLEKLYDKYRFVIGPVQYKKMSASMQNDVALSSSFTDNLKSFQSFLKATGFLRELSDATSIVINPYEEIEEGDI